jgi:hypothetical protein
LTEVALKALELDEFDDAFFTALPKILPYNLFTLKKLVKREVFPHRIKAIEERIDEHISKLRGMVHAVYAQQKREFATLHQQWERDRLQWEREQSNKPSVLGGMTPPPSVLGVSGVAPIAALSGTPHSPGAGVSSPGPGAREPEDDGRKCAAAWMTDLCCRITLIRLVTLSRRTEMEVQVLGSDATRDPSHVRFGRSDDRVAHGETVRITDVSSRECADRG